jgi:hypothetical protein
MRKSNPATCAVLPQSGPYLERLPGQGRKGGEVKKLLRLLVATMVMLGSISFLASTVVVAFRPSLAGADGPVTCEAGSTQPADPGQGFCANYNGDTTWYGTYGNTGSAFPSTDGFGLCADRPASGGAFPAPDYHYVAGSAPAGSGGDQNALGFALSQAAASGWWGGSSGHFTADQAGAAAKLFYDNVVWGIAIPSLDPGTGAALAALEGWFNEAVGSAAAAPTLSVGLLGGGTSFAGSGTVEVKVTFAGSNSGVHAQALILNIVGGTFNSAGGPTVIGVSTNSSGVVDVPVFASSGSGGGVTVNVATSIGTPAMDFYHPTQGELSAQILAGFVAPTTLTASAALESKVVQVQQTGTVSIQKSGSDTAYYGLAGAVFQILSGSTVESTLTTNAAGATPQSAPLAVGPYTVHELTAPAGYGLAANQTVTVGANQNTVASFTGVNGDFIAPSFMTLHKVDAQTSAPLAGAVFDVAYSTGNNGRFDQDLGTCTTKADGTCEPDGNDGGAAMLPGDYQVTEDSAPPGYYLNPATSTQEVVLAPGQAASATFSDFLLGSLALAKSGNDTAYASIAGATFSVTGPGSATTVIGSLVVGSNGSSPILTGLTPGTYTLTETVPPTGYAAITPLQVAVTEGSAATAVNVVDSVVPATLTIMKTDLQTKAPLAGAVLDVRYDPLNSGTYDDDLGTCTTTTSGSCMPTGNDGPTALLPGTYQITETQAPPGYALSSSGATQDITLTPGEAGTVTFADALLVPAAFQKVATGNVNVSELTLAGATIDVHEGAATGATVTSCVTTGDGVCATTSLLQAGSIYCWVEVAAPAGLQGGAQGCFTAANAQASEPITVTDAGEFVGLSVKKVDAGDTAVVLPGAVFDLYREDGGVGPGLVPVPPADAAVESAATWVGRAATEADGVATFALQYPGFAYCAVEQTAPANYVLSSAPTCTGVLSGSATLPALSTQLTVADTEATLNLQAHKFNSTTPDTGIPNATYDLYVEGSGPPSVPVAVTSSAIRSDVTAVPGDTWFARGITDAEGNLNFTVPAGYAWCLLEHSAPVDYIPDPGMHCSEVLTTGNDDSSSAATPAVALPETLATIYLSARKYNSLTPNTVIAGATYELLVEGPMPTGYETPTPDGPVGDASGTLTGPMGENANDYVPSGDNYWGEGTTNAQGLLSFAVPAGYAWCLHELDAPADYLPDPGFHCTSILTNQSPATAATIALPEVQKPGGGLAFTGGPSGWMPMAGAALVLTGSGLLAVRRRLERGHGREDGE